MIEYLQNHYLVCCILVMSSSILISLLIIPSVIHVAKVRSLYDDFGHFRKQHDHGIPRLGGVAIFVSFTVTLLLFGIADKALPINYLLTACIMLFAMGIKDDLSGVNLGTKFAIEFVTGLILVIAGNIRLTSIYGIFDIYEISYIPSVILSVVVIIFIVNAFNLIDGINCLSAATGITVNIAFSVLFIYAHQYELATISLSLAGAILGFIKFNITPAKIFMGDTGSLLIGLVSAIMAIKFVEVNKLTGADGPVIYSAPGLAAAILIGPLSDALRVFIIRISNGKSPFKADRNHIHHRLLRLGFSHMQTTGMLIAANVSVILLAFLLTDYGNAAIIICIASVSIIFNWILTFSLRSKERKNYKLRNFFA